MVGASSQNKEPPHPADVDWKRWGGPGRKDGHAVTQPALEAADYVLILTTLSEADGVEILARYRLRWQKIAFKRLKSLIQIDALRAFDSSANVSVGETARRRAGGYDPTQGLDFPLRISRPDGPPPPCGVFRK